MLRAFYDYLADITLSYFNEASLKGGDKYTLKLENPDDVQAFYDSVKDHLVKNNRMVDCKLPTNGDEFITASFVVDGIQLVIVPEIDVTNAYLTHLRNWINDCADKSILLICHNPVDSISNGTESLQKEDMPFHKKRFCNTLENAIKNSQMNNVDKQILFSSLTKVKDSGYLDSYSLHDFEEILEALDEGYISEDNYPKFGLLRDVEFESTFGLCSQDEIQNRINMNSEMFTIIDASAKRGNIEDDLSKIFTLNFTDKVKKAAEDKQGKWYEDITFAEALKAQKAKKAKGDPLVVEKITIRKDDISLVDGKDFFVRNETARGNKKHILAFTPEKNGKFTITIEFSDNFKTDLSIDADKDTKEATQAVQALKKITLNITNLTNSFVKVIANQVKRNDSEATDRFVFSIGIIGCEKSWFDQSFQTSFKIKATKSKGSCLILSCADKMLFNKRGSDIESITMKDGFDEVLNNKETQYELLFNGDSFDDSNKCCGDITIDGNRIPIEFDCDTPISTTISGIRIEQIKLSERCSFQYIGGNKLQFGTNEYNTATDFRKNLVTEKFIIDNCAMCCEFKSETEIQSITLDVPNRVFKAFKELIAYFRAHDTLPSLAYYDNELCVLAQEYVDSVVEVFDSLKHGQPLSGYVRNVLKLGTVYYPAEEIIAFSPLHPINVAFRLHLAEEDCSSKIREDVLKKISSDNLLPLIHKEETRELYRVQEQSDSPQWTIYAPAKRKKYMGQRKFVSGLVRDKIERFRQHFKYLFDGVGNNEIIINAVNMGNCTELFKGIVEYYRSELKPDSLNIDNNRLMSVTVNVYNELQVYNAFESLSNKAALKKILNDLGYRYDKEAYSESEFINLFMTKVKYYKLNIKDKHYRYSHLAFVEMDQKSDEGFSNVKDIRSGSMLGGLMSGVTSMYYGDTKEYRTGYGINFNCDDNQLLKLANVYNTAMYVFGSNNPYQENVVSCTKVDEHQNDMIESTYEASNWVVFIDPRVDLNFFKNDKQQDVMIIHYSDQHTSSSGYDSITVTRKTRQYENIITDYLKKNNYSGGTHDEVRQMIDMFNAVNGDWLLKLISYNSTFTKEKISIQSAIKLAMAFLKDDNITWIPISLEEILRVSGSVGYAQKDGLFTAKNLGFDRAPTSDDLLMFGVEKVDGKVLVHLYPLEVKIGYENEDELTKAKEQIKRTRKIFDENLLRLEHPNFIQNKVYRNFIVQLAIVSAEKMNLYHVWESQDWEQIVNTDTRGKLLNDDFVVSTSLRDTLGDGIVLSFKKGGIKRTSERKDSITTLRFLESDGRKYVTKSVDDIYLEMLLMPDVRGSMLGNFSSEGFVEPINDVLPADDSSISTDETEYYDDTKSEENTVPAMATVGAGYEETIGENEPFCDAEAISEPLVVSEDNPVSTSEPQTADEDNILAGASGYVPSPNGMKILIGEEVNDHAPIYWYPNDTTKIMHPNTGIIGTMGTGKTQFTKSLVTQLVREQRNNPGGEPIGILIFDYKGDYNENKADFIEATGAKVYKLFHLPFNPFSLTIPATFKPMLPLHTANAFVATITKTYHIGNVQANALRTCIKTSYEQKGILSSDPSTWNNTAPTLADVYANYVSGDSFKEDSLSTALSTLTEFEIFEPEPSATMPLYDFIDGVTVIDLSGYDQLIQDLVVAVTLDLFYSQMQAHGHSLIDGKLRQLTKFILVDEADNFLKMGYPAMRKILKEGREFGVGTILSTQFLKHFHTDEDDFSSYILNWIVHRVDDLSSKEVKSLFNTSSKGQEDSLYNEIKRLDKHYSIVKLGSSASPYYCKDKAFWELIKDES